MNIPGNHTSVILVAALSSLLGGCALESGKPNLEANCTTQRPLYASADKSDLDKWLARALVQIALIPPGPNAPHEKVSHYCRIALLQARSGDLEGAKKAIGLATDAAGQSPVFTAFARLDVQFYAKAAGDKPSDFRPDLATQCDLILSTPVLSELAELPEIRRMEIMKAVDDPVAFIKSRLTVTPDHDFINISFASANRIEGAQLVNAIADVYVTFAAKQHHNSAAEVLKILQKEKEKREVELDARRRAKAEFLRNHNVLSFKDEKYNIVLQKLSRLSEALTTAQLDVLDAQSNLDAAEAVKNDPARILELARSDQSREASPTLQPPKVDATHQKEADQKLVDSYLDRLRRRTVTASQRERLLFENFDEQQKKAFDLSATAAEFASLESDYDRTARLVGQLEDRIKDLNVSEDTGMVSVSVINPASPAAEPPTVNQNLAIIGQAQARIGDFAGVQATLARILGNGPERDTVRTSLAAAQAKAGNLTESAKTLTQIEDPARRQPAADFDRDPSDFQPQFDPSFQHDAANPAFPAARAGRFSNALEIAAGLPPDDRAAAYAQVAYFQAMQGDRDGARATFELAQNSVPPRKGTSTAGGQSNLQSLRVIIEAEAWAGILNDAFALAGKQSEDFELEAIAFIATRELRIEDLLGHSKSANGKSEIAIGAAEAILAGQVASK